MGEIQAEIAARLRSCRARLDLTQQQAGNRAGVSWMTISRAERGERIPTVDILYKLAIAYGVQITDLLPPTPAPKPGRPRKPA